MTDAPAKDRSGSDHRKGLPLAFLIFGVTVLFAIAATALIIAATDDIGSVDEQTAQGASDDGGSGSGTGGASLEADEEAVERNERSGAAGELTAGGFDLLGGAARAGDVVGEDGEGRGVRVVQVVPGEGFFVGTNDEDRVYVEFGGDVGEDETSELPEQGDAVDLRGPVRPAPQDPEQTLELDAEQAADVEEDGFYVNADRVVPAG